MRKFTKALSVILALSMMLTTFVFTVNAETVTTKYSVDFTNLTDENDGFKFYKGSWGDNLFTSLTELTGTATQIANGNMTLWRGGDGVNYMKTQGNALVIEFTAPKAGTYRFYTAGSVPTPKDNGATKVSKYDASENAYTDISGETNITRVNYYWTDFNLSDTENPAAELDAGDKLYWTILNWNTFQAIVTELSVVGVSEADAEPVTTVTHSVDFSDLANENDAFKFYEGTWNSGAANRADGSFYAGLTELQPHNEGGVGVKGNRTNVWLGNDGVKYMKAGGGSGVLVVEFTAPKAGTYRFDTAGRVPNASSGGATVISLYDASEQTYTDMSPEVGLSANPGLYYYWGEFNASETANPFVEMEAGDKLYMSLVEWGTYQAVISRFDVIGTVAVEPEPEPEPEPTPVPSYSAAISATPTDVSRGGSTTVKVTVDGTVYTKFAAGELEIAYDAEKYDFVSAKIGGTDITSNVVNGKVTVGFYGAELDFGTTIDLTFTIKDGVAIGTVSEFTLTAAAFSDSETAVSADLTVAEIATATATTTVVARTFDVTIDAEEDVKSAILAVEGNTTVVTEEQAYVIILPAGNERYNWTATVGENTYTAADGKITIPATEATSAYTVAITRVSKVFSVTGNVTGDGLTESDTFNGAPEAIFGTDYTFTVPAPVEPNYVTGTAGVAYDVSAYYTGTNTPVVATPVTENGVVTYTIAGASITADITVEIVKVITEVDQYTVTVNGFDSDISGTATTLVNEGQPFSFTITPIAGFEYTVTSDDAVIVKDGNTYRIEAVNSNVNITVTRTAKPDGTYVYKFLDLKNAAIYQVVVKGEVAEGYGYTYDGNAMLYNAKTGEYVYLVIVTEAFTVEDAAAKVGLSAGVINTEYNVNGVDTDVNITGKTDANDAQLVYNIYASKTYDSFDVLPMLKFLLSDVNCDHSVGVDDAQAIINTILG